MFDEMQVFMTCLDSRENRQRFLAGIPRNVLSRDEAIEVSERFNGLTPGSLSHFGDDSSDIFHPFRDLYLAGLLGVVDVDHETGTLTQRFRQPQDVLQDVGFELPASDQYLIHPALNSFIAQHRTTTPYLVHQHALIGHGRVWEPYYSLFCELEKHLTPSLGSEVLTAGYRLLEQIHAQLKSKRQGLMPLFAGSEWQTIRKAAPVTDELVYWLEELREVVER